MRFIEGESFKQALERFHEADRQPGRDPGERGVALRQLLGRFIAVCNTVAYAHSRGVLHRDLKPANIMLGKYGETLVVDWGLAKLFQRTEAEQVSGEETLRPVSDSGAEGTRLGEVRGTPAFMSPEQAAGRWDVVGPASDVYGLGATLYYLLTGQASYRGGNHAEVLQKVQQGDCPPPRQVKPGVPRPLEAVCRKVMALRPEDRYATALALAADIEHWLADEPVAAYGEPLPVRARRWARKHKPLVAGLAALLLTAAALGGGFGLWWKQQHDALVGAVQDHLDRAEQLRDIEQWDPAGLALDRAEERLAGGGPPGLHRRLQRLRDQLEVVRQLDNARMQQLTIVEGKFDYAGADRAYQKVFAGLGLDPLGAEAEGKAEQIIRSPLRKQLAIALDNWTFVKERLRSREAERLLAVARLADDDPWRQQLRDPAVRQDRARLEGLAADGKVLAQPPVNLLMLSRLLTRRKSPAVAERLLREAQQHYPTDFWLVFQLANHLYEQQSSRKEEALGLYRAALALQPQSVAIWNNLGNLLQKQQKPAEAEAAYRKALQHQPDYPGAWTNLGNLLQEQQKPAEAEAAYGKAIEHRPDYAAAWYNLGNLLQKQQKPAKAEEAYREAIRHQPDYARAWYSLGDLLKAQQKPAEAEEAYREGLHHQPDDAKAWYNLGILLYEQQKSAEAEAAFRKAIQHQPDLAEAHCNLSVLLRDQGRLAEAAAAVRKGHELGSRNPAWPYRSRSAQWVSEAERLVELDAKLPALLKGESKPDAAELIELARLCQQPYKQLHAASARFYRDAFAAQPKLTEAHRYKAACAAALAGCGQGKDAETLDDLKRVDLRQQALDWLQKELMKWTRLLEDDPDKARPTVQQAMERWQKDAALTGVRGDALAKLPEVERKEWQKLWEEVEALHQRAAGPK